MTDADLVDGERVLDQILPRLPNDPAVIAIARQFRRGMPRPEFRALAALLVRAIAGPTEASR